MRILKPSEPCPCCGMPIRGDLPRRKLLLLSYIAEGLSLMDAISALDEVMELPPLGGAAVEPEESVPDLPHSPESNIQVPISSEAEEKRAILDRLTAYRAARGLGSLEDVSKKTAHNKNARLSSDSLRMVLSGEVKLSITDWRKIRRALDVLEGSDG